MTPEEQNDVIIGLLSSIDKLLGKMWAYLNVMGIMMVIILVTLYFHYSGAEGF